MDAWKEIDLFLLRLLFVSSGLKYPFIPDHPYALFGLSCHRLNVLIPHTYVLSWQCMHVLLQHHSSLALQRIILSF